MLFRSGPFRIVQVGFAEQEFSFELVPLEMMRENPDDLELRCTVNGEQMQSARTSEMIFSVSQQIAYLSSICRLFPGDVIFTGTPSGIGASRGQFLKDGDVIVSSVVGVGEISNTCVGA